MEYTSHQVCKLSGVSARTLRYYDAIGLLKPKRVASSGYRIYGHEELDKLQSILFCRELDFSLEEIKRMLDAPDYDKVQAFERHLTALYHKWERLDVLIGNIAQSLAAMKGEEKMDDKAKFEGFKQQMLDENDRRYGKEVRARYGEQAAAASVQAVKGMTQSQYNESERLRIALEKTLLAAFHTGDPAGTFAQEACDLHRHWLRIFYPGYNKDYHRALGEMYVSDDRFRANYDKIAPGCTEFLRDAINIYCK